MACCRTWGPATLLLVAAMPHLQQALRSQRGWRPGWRIQDDTQDNTNSMAHPGNTRAESGGGAEGSGIDVGRAAALNATMSNRRRIYRPINRRRRENIEKEAAAVTSAADSTSESEAEDDLVIILEDHTDVMPARLLASKSRQFNASSVAPIPSSTERTGAATGMDASALRTNRIFVGGLGECNLDVLLSYFGQYNVVDATVIRDNKNGKSRGFGYVQFDHFDAVDEIMQFGHPHHIDTHTIEINRLHNLNDRRVVVKRAIPKEAMADTRPLYRAVNSSIRRNADRLYKAVESPPFRGPPLSHYVAPTYKAFAKAGDTRDRWGQASPHKGPYLSGPPSWEAGGIAPGIQNIPFLGGQSKTTLLWMRNALQAYQDKENGRSRGVGLAAYNDAATVDTIMSMYPPNGLP